jgi:two-component system CheB/CheR fusion protein
MFFNYRTPPLVGIRIAFSFRETLRFPMGLQGIRVLVIEDADEIRDLFTALLQAEGAQVEATGSGLEGAELARQHDFDVVLSDLGLPDVPGDVVIRQIRSTSRRLRVLVITGHGEPFLTRARQAGADVVLTKPVDWERILEHLQPPGFAATA